MSNMNIDLSKNLWTQDEYNRLINIFAEKLTLYFRNGVVTNFNSSITPFLYTFLPINQKKLMFFFHWLISKPIQYLFSKVDLIFHQYPILSQNSETISRGRIEGTPLWTKTFQILSFYNIP